MSEKPLEPIENYLKSEAYSAKVTLYATASGMIVALLKVEVNIDSPPREYSGTGKSIKEALLELSENINATVTVENIVDYKQGK